MNDEIQDLLIQCLRGDNKAKGELLKKLKPAILGAIKRYYNIYQEYDDLIQEGYEVILKCINEFDFNKKVHFLWFIKLRLKFYYLDKNKGNIGHASLNSPIFTEGEDVELLDIIPDDEPSQEEVIINNESNEELRKGLNKLTQRQKDVIIMYYFHKQSMKNIAQTLGVSYRTVVNIKTKAICNLKKSIRI